MKSWWGRSWTPSDPTRKHPFDLSTNPKPGFMGNLTVHQYHVLQQFKIQYAAAVKSFYDESFSVAFSKEEEETLAQVYPDDPGESRSVKPVASHRLSELDGFLLRFLRARAFDLAKASKMLDDYIKWRLSFHVKEICEVVRFPWVAKLRQVYPHGYHGVDKMGRPIYIERIGKSDISAALKIASFDHLLAYWVQQYEYVRRVILPACSIAAGRRIEQGISIVDLSGLGFSHCGSQTRMVVRQIAQLSQDYFPEMLGAMVLVNVPAVFGPLWAFARTLIDERTVSKITLLTSRSTHWREYLQKLVDPDQLPEFLGGTAPDKGWDSNKGPWADSNILSQLEKRMPSIPHSLVHFDPHVGNLESLKALDGVSAPVLEIETEDSSAPLEQEPSSDDDVTLEFNKLSQSGVNVVE